MCAWPVTSVLIQLRCAVMHIWLRLAENCEPIWFILVPQGFICLQHSIIIKSSYRWPYMCWKHIILRIGEKTKRRKSVEATYVQRSSLGTTRILFQLCRRNVMEELIIVSAVGQPTYFDMFWWNTSYNLSSDKRYAQGRWDTICRCGLWGLFSIIYHAHGMKITCRL